MAELTIRVKAIYDEVIECRSELAKVEKQMKNLKADSSADEVNRLMEEYNRLYKRWEDGMARLGKIGAYTRNAFEEVGEVLGEDADLIAHIDKASSNMVATIAKRAKAELDVNDALQKQREELLANRDSQKKLYEDTKATYMQIKKEFDAKPEAERTADDKALMSLYEEQYQGVKKAWDEINDKVAVYDSMLEVSANRMEKMTKDILEAKSGFEDMGDDSRLSQYRMDANTLIDSLNEAGEKVAELQEGMSTDEGFLKRLFSGGDFDKQTQQIEEYGAAVKEAYGIANAAMNAQQSYIDVLTEKMGEYEKQIAEATDPQEVEKLQASFAGLKAEQESALGVLESIKSVLGDLDESIDNADGMKNRADRYNSVLDKIKKLKEMFTNSGAKDMQDDVKELEKELDTAGDTFIQFYKKADESTNSLKSSLKQLAGMAGLAFSVREIGGFMDKVMQTREYFQDIESSMKVFLGSAEAGAEFTDNLKDYAYYNMYEFSDLAQASQQMISYGHAVDSIIPRLDQLSNVATGTHGSLMELVDAYNRAKATGVVDARGVQSWAVKGVMIRDVLRDMGEQATGTQVTFEQLNKVLDKVTGEGGQFHNLMLEMMDNISAEKGQLEDNLSSMYNAIGEQYQDIIVKWYKFQSELVDNYEAIGGEVLDLGAKFAEFGIDTLRDNLLKLVSYVKDAIVVFGTWKVMIATLTPIHKLHTWWINAEATAHAVNAGKIKLEGVARGQATAAIIRQTQAQKMLNASVLASPWTWAAAAITGVVYALYSYHESVMTAEKAQKLLSSATEDYNDAAKEQNSVDQENIGIIKDKTKSLLEQTRAYKQLIKDREVFAAYTKEEIAKMTPEQISQIQSQDNEAKNEERLRNQVEAAKELQKMFASRAFAWSETGEDEEIEKIVEKYKLSAEYAEKLKNSIGSWTDLSDWADELVKATGDELQTYLADSAKDGIAEGFKNGFTDSSLQDEATKMIKNYSNDLVLKTKEVEDKILETQKKVKELEKSSSGVSVSKTTAAAVGIQNVFSGMAKNSEIMKLNKEIEDFQANLAKTRQEVADTFVKQMQPKIEETKKKLESLNKEYLNATGEKKTEIDTKIKDTNNELNTLKSMMHFFEEGATNKELIVKITEDVHDSILGDEKLAEIGKAYEKIENETVKFVEGIDKAREEMDIFTEISEEDAQRIAEKYHITANDIEESFGTAFDETQKQIADLNEELNKTTDPNKKNEILLDIAEKEKLLQYIGNIRTQLENFVKDPYTVNLKFVGKAEKWLKDLLGAAGIIIPERENAQKAQEKGKAAQARIDEENKPGELRGNYKDYQKRKQQREKQDDNEYRIFKAGGVSKTRKDAKGNFIDYGKLTDKEIEDMEKTFSESAKRAKTGAKDSKQILQRRQKDYDMYLKNREQQQKQEKEALNATEEARIAEIENGTQREREARKNQFRLVQQQLDEQIEAFKKVNVEQEKAEWQNKKENKDKIWADTKTAQDIKANGYANIALTADQQAQVDAIRRKNAAEEKRYYKEQEEAQVQALLDYQKEYGDFQMQREAITKEYDLKIDKEQDEIQKAALARQKERLISELNMKELQQSLDWETVFNNLEYQGVEALQSLKRQLAQALDMKDITAENAKVLAEKIREIEDSIARKTDIWSSWIPGLRERKRLSLEILEVENKIKGLTTARNTSGASQDTAISKFASSVGVTEGSFKQQWQQINKGNIGDIRDAYKSQIEASEDVRKAFEELETTTTDLAKSEENLTQAQKDRKTRQEALKNFTKGGNVGQYFKDVTAGMDVTGIFGLVNQNAQSANNLLNNIGLGNTEFGKGFAEFAEGMQGFQNGIQSLLQGDVFGAINGVVDGIQGFGDAIGRAFGINWSGGNEAEHAKREQELIKANEQLQRSIDKLTEAFNNTNGAKAIQLSNDIIKKQQEFNDNVMARWENDMGYHSAHHSNAANWEGFSQEQIDRMNALLAQMDARYGDAKDRQGNTAKINSASWRELTNLTPEALDYIRAYLPDVWDFITSRGDYAWVYDSLNEYADLTGVIAEQTEALTENLSQLSSSALHDQFLSDLMNMDKKANDFGKDFTKILAQAVLNAQIGDLMDDQLKAFRDEIANRMKKEGGMTKQDVEDLRAMWDSIVQAGMTARNTMADITGYTGKDSQTATGKSLENMSYTQADSLIGIATAQQIALEQSRDRLDMLNVKADQVYMLTIESRDIAADSRQILAGMAIHVEEIRDGMVDTLVPAIKDMRSDLAKVRKLVEEQ